MLRTLLAVLAFALAAIQSPAALAGSSCIWSVIDHKWTKDNAGIWDPTVYRTLMDGLTLAQVGAALWEGSESRFGKSSWQGMDAGLLTAGSVEVMKRAFTRMRPADTDDPCRFFAHDSNHSFPSGEAAQAAALVAPYLFEYGGDHPATYGLLLLPIYVGVARIKDQAHWQSDVLAGWAVGGLWGWYAHSRDTPLVVQILPGGVFVGIKARF
ncbi:MAG TPA: phosphatase PAP2 family protein [Burkholderiaceae bacterium]|nr:phosphatase PAP2 family protein [Burkholderiaceae bacterium]